MSKAKFFAERVSNSIKLFGGFSLPTLEHSYYFKSHYRSLAGLNKNIEDIGALAKTWREARKSPFLKMRLAKFPRYTGSTSSFYSNRKAFWEKTSKDAWSDVGLNTLQDVLGTKKTLQEKRAVGKIKKDFFMEWEANYDLKKMEELSKKVKSHFRRFRRSDPKQRHLKEIRNMSRATFGADIGSTLTFKDKGFSKSYINQGNYLEFGKQQVSPMMRDLKKLRKVYVSENFKLPKVSKNSQDRIINARSRGIRFIRKNGRIIPIRVKK